MVIEGDSAGTEITWDVNFHSGAGTSVRALLSNDKTR